MTYRVTYQSAQICTSPENAVDTQSAPCYELNCSPAFKDNGISTTTNSTVYVVSSTGYFNPVKAKRQSLAWLKEKKSTNVQKLMITLGFFCGIFSVAILKENRQ